MNASPDMPITANSAQCPRCKSKLKPTAAFCTKCGMQCAQPANQSTAHNYSKMLPTAIVVACLLTAAALIMFGLRPVESNPEAAAEPAPVSSVYVAPPPVVDAPLLPAENTGPATRTVLNFPTTQIVELPKETRYFRFKTQMLGATTGGGPYEITGPGHEPVIGFRVTTADWGGKSIVRTLQPVYPSDNSVVTRSMIVARQGYAVGGVIVDGDDHVTAMRIVFMRIEPHGLSLKDPYYSDWIGQPTGDMTHLLGGRGLPVIGIFGRRGMNVDALGLILLTEAKD